MVSTRGVKFKFSENEKVLCYEPDTTKAKVLYDSKVLELNVSRDSRGRKVPEYLIHFFGWSSNWDRCVKEEFILQDTEENRNLQIKLAKDASLCLKGKRKVKLPPIIKESLSKQDDEDEEEDEKEPPKVAQPEVPESSSDSDMTDSDEEKNVEIEIPTCLKDILEKDWFYINQKNRVFKLPCDNSVIYLLENFMKYSSSNLESSVDSKDVKKEKDSTATDIEDKVHFCKEVMDGLRVYFDFTLPHLLLYRQEKKQFYTIGNTCLPINKSQTGKMNLKNSSLDIPISPNSISIKEETKSSIHSPTRGGLRNQLSRQKSPPSQDEEMTDLSQAKGLDRVRQRSKKLKLVGPRRSLRSGDKPKSAVDDMLNSPDGLAADASGHESDHSMRVDSPPTSPSRLTRRSSQNTPSATSSIVVKSSPSSKRASNQANVAALSSPNAPTNDKKCDQQIASNLVLPADEPWKLVPQSFYTQIPAAPSLIYGGQHLLRLFVKLPELMHKMNIPHKRLIPLLEVIQNFLEYLVEKKDELFLNTYIDSGEENAEASCGSN